MEPLDQLDGFLLAKYIQELFGAEQSFYPYIAGAYNSLNSRSAKEAVQIAAKRYNQDRIKSGLVKNLMKNIGITGEVLTTYNLWNDTRYWQIVSDVVDGGVVDKLPEELKSRGIRIREFPKEILGVMGKVVGRKLDWLFSGSLYVPAEVAEAIRIKELFGVEWKIGPYKTEQLYDEQIYQYGIGIIGMEQPLAIENGETKEVLPYIGKTTQPQRIFFSDTAESLARKATLNNPSYQRALTLADIFGLVTNIELPEYGLSRVLELVKLKR